MAKYRKKPVIVEAEQWLPRQSEWPGRGVPDKLGVIWVFNSEGHVCEGIIETLEGDHKVSIGDWIIIGVKGERYPCKPDIFEQTYELVED